MAPYALAECVFCHTLIPASCYPGIGQTKNGKCPACGKALAPRLKVDEDELLGKADLNVNGIPDEWEKQYALTDAGQDSDEDTDGFTRRVSESGTFSVTRRVSPRKLDGPRVVTGTPPSVVGTLTSTLLPSQARTVASSFCA